MLIAAVGEGYCFLIDGFSYMAVIGSLLAMVVKPKPRERARASVLAELVEGWQYARGFRPIWAILLLLSLISLVGMQYTTLMPIFAGRIPQGGSHTLGLLMAAVWVRWLALQTIVEDEKRGRVMSFYSMAIQGVALFGSLVAGAAASWIGAPRTLTIGGAICVAGAGLFAPQLPSLRKLIRPIYVRMGIIPEVATGLQAAAIMQSPAQE